MRVLVYRAAMLAAMLLCALGAHAATMQCPPLQQMTGAPYPSGGPYTADAAGIVTGVNGNDVPALAAAGCQLIGAADGMIGRLLGANMNVTTDQQIPLWVAPSQYYRVTKITFKNCSGSVTTAVGGVYTAASKGGTVVVASGQAYSGITGSTLALDLTIASTPGLTEFIGTTPLYLSLSIAQGAAMTCDAFVFAQVGQ
jgi:hypothetical protein